AQILQAAFILTDDDMNPLASQKVESRRAAWVVPSPAALLITGITPSALKKTKKTQYEMMRDVYKWVEGQHWPLLFVGYNSKRFDRKVISANLAAALMP